MSQHDKTRRDFFAIQVLQGLLVSSDDGNNKTLVHEAVILADLLCEELDLTEKTTDTAQSGAV